MLFPPDRKNKKRVNECPSVRRSGAVHIFRLEALNATSGNDVFGGGDSMQLHTAPFVDIKAFLLTTESRNGRYVQ